jgi:hypothetical protein
MPVLPSSSWVQTKIVDDMCMQLPFIDSTAGIGALLKSAVITLFMLRNDTMTSNEKSELLEMASATGSDAHLPQNVPRQITLLNHLSPAHQLPVTKLLGPQGNFLPIIVGCARDALQGALPTSVYPYVNEPPPGFEPFNPDSTLDDELAEDLLRASVEPMLIVVMVGGLSFNELQDVHQLVTKTRRTVLCIAMHMTTAAAYLAQMFTTS